LAIQIEQKFPRCQRCGKLIHFRAERIEADDLSGNHIVFCTQICYDEFEARFGIGVPGVLRTGSMAGQRSA
jgi:hypothetical protein